MPTVNDSQPVSIRLENDLIEYLKLIARCKSIAQGHKIAYTDLIRESILAAYPMIKEISKMSEIERICWTQVLTGVEKMKLTGEDICIISQGGSRYPAGSPHTVALVEHDYAAREYGMSIIARSIPLRNNGQTEEAEDYVLLSKTAEATSEQIEAAIQDYRARQRSTNKMSVQEKLQRGYRIQVTPDNSTTRVFKVMFDPKTAGQAPLQTDGSPSLVPRSPYVVVDMNHEPPATTFDQGGFNDPDITPMDYEAEAIRRIGTPEVFHIGHVDLVKDDLPRQIGQYIRDHSAHDLNCYIAFVTLPNGEKLKVSGDYAEVNIRIKGEYSIRFRVRFAPFNEGQQWEYKIFPSKHETA